jgi:hypothetical protein
MLALPALKKTLTHTKGKQSKAKGDKKEKWQCHWRQRRLERDAGSARGVRAAATLRRLKICQ